MNETLIYALVKKRGALLSSIDLMPKLCADLDSEEQESPPCFTVSCRNKDEFLALLHRRFEVTTGTKEGASPASENAGWYDLFLLSPIFSLSS